MGGVQQMEFRMQQSTEYGPRRRIGRSLMIASALLCATTLSRLNPAYAGADGGGRGFHGAIRGFHGGGFAGFHGGEFHRDGFRDGRFDRDRFRDRRFFFGGSFFYPWWGYYPNYGYYDYDQTFSSQIWYYCTDPAGYYPYVTQCNTGWQAVPAS
jgi:hypothetical protein